MRTIETHHLRLALDGDWRWQGSEDNEQFSLTSKTKDIEVALSTSDFDETIDPKQMAVKLQELRLGAEQSAAMTFSRRIELAEPQLTPFERGWYLQYFGQDNTGRSFRYFGIVIAGKLVNIYVESKTANLAELEAALQEFFAGLQF